MKKATSSKKLNLSRQSIRVLQTGELDRVAGARNNESKVCPPTWDCRPKETRECPMG